MSIFVAGLDLGQLGDYTALAIVEATPSTYQQPYAEMDPEFHLPRTATMQVEGMPVRHDVRWLERFALHTSYVDICEAVGRRLGRVPGGAELVIDRTGVGVAVSDLLNRVGLAHWAVSITAGEKARREGNLLWVPKRDLVGVLRVAADSDRIGVAPELPASELLTQELLGFKVKISTAGNDSYGAWRESVHDDLVLAVALAAWFAEQHYGAAARGQLDAAAQAELDAERDDGLFMPPF